MFARSPGGARATNKAAMDTTGYWRLLLLLLLPGSFQL
jgi:hypothetical protein